MILFILLLFVVAVVVWMTARLNMHPFLALLFAALSMGFLAGLDGETLMGALGRGFGSTLQSIGIVIAAGAIIGEYLDRSGGAQVLAGRILAWTGEKRAPLSMSITGYIVSIPVFCDSGFIVLSALNRAIARRTKVSLGVLAVALASGLYATHVFVPPTPGPLAAAATIDADIGWVMLLGLIVSLPVMASALIWAVSFCNIELNAGADSQQQKVEKPSAEPPAFSVAILPILIPILLIAGKSLAEYPTLPLGDGLFYQVFLFLGNPVIALLAGVILAFGMVRRGASRIRSEWLEEALKKAGVIILITGAGGAFGAVLRETDLGELAEQFVGSGEFAILVAFLAAAFLKSAQGSSTVAIITSAAIMAPLVEPMGFGSAIGRALIVLAIGAGSLTVSHVNDSYFWVVAKFSSMETAQALRTHTVATFIMGITGLVTIQVIAWIVM
ncbi:MAG: GntP family permease [Balneolaceae bacterium]